MNYSIFDFISLLGAVCLFLYGMKVMSEGLQKVAGDRLRNILGIMTKNRVTGVITGILITALIQSSSASTVMVVSFVNAGLMSLGQAMAVIFGANVGTTVTTWIISAFSFEVNISDYSVLLLAVGVPMLFMKKSFYKSLGEFLIGFCFLFMGLDLISHYVPNLQENPSMLEFLTKYTSMGYGSVLIFFFIGIIVTMVAQSSAATFAITLIMCSQGWITYELGCAIILGGNIGTTITPVLASLSGNLAAKRTAMGHVLFNVLGSIIVLIIFVPFVTLVADITQWLEGTNPMTITAAEESAMADSTLLTPAGGLTAKAQASMAFALAMFPTVFNACNLLIMIWFTNLYVKIVCWIMPARHKETRWGALVKDESRGITNISYDRFGNPLRISFKDGSYTENVYSASGEKLRMTHATSLNGTVTGKTTTEYRGNFIYRDGKVDMVLFPGGYATINGSAVTFHYYTQEYRGNNRAVINGSTGAVSRMAFGKHCKARIKKEPNLTIGLLF